MTEGVGKGTFTCQTLARPNLEDTVVLVAWRWLGL
jgi:hypothetical protein